MLGLFYLDGQAMITNAESAFSEPITGVVAKDGEIIFSRFRHDYQESTDGSVFVDGGRDYLRTNTHPDRVISLVVSKNRLVKVP